MHPISLLIISCFLFSMLAALIKFLSDFIDPIQQSFFRNFLSVIILLPFILKQKFFVKSNSSYKLLALRAFFGGITMVLLFKAYSLIPLSQAMAISFSTPLFMYFGSILFLDEKVDPFKTSLLLIGFILTLIIIRPDIKIETGSLLALISAFTHACAGLLVKKISYKENVLTLMFSMVLIMTPITFIPSIYVWEFPNSFFIIFMLLSIAIVATLGNFFWTKAISLSTLTNLMPFDFTKLIFATFLGLIFFNEKIDKITTSCGIGLIICNTLIMNRVKNENS
jgi:drug/metabolite transporter (DMT)-like permease